MTDRDLIDLFKVLHQGFTITACAVGKMSLILKGERGGDAQDCLEIIAMAEDAMSVTVERAQTLYEASQAVEEINTARETLTKLAERF